MLISNLFANDVLVSGTGSSSQGHMDTHTLEGSLCSADSHGYIVFASVPASSAFTVVLFGTSLQLYETSAI